MRNERTVSVIFDDVLFLYGVSLSPFVGNADRGALTSSVPRIYTGIKREDENETGVYRGGLCKA
ncbi:hypothetical protein IMZ48_10120 [Candidatus Bathyarchaeota archaeon]|nr:hypothetical protein [Candidatus Bathyarchaeota archaeon]